MRIIIFILILCLNHNNGVSQSCITETYTSQIGVREATGRNDGKKVELYLKSVGLVAMYKKQDEYNEELKYQLTASINTQIQRFNALESSIKRDAKQQKRKGIAIGSSLGIGLSLTLGLLIFQIIK